MNCPPLLLLKLGGSLITRRAGSREADADSVQRFIQVIHSRWEQLRHRLVIILGGGSFGHNSVAEYGIHLPPSEVPPANVMMLSVNMLGWKTWVAERFREGGVPCYPFQTTSYVTTDDHHPVEVHLEPILQALSMGLLPILSGDTVFDRRRGFVVFSSDRVPELFAGRVPVARTVVLTDVPGILEETPEGPRSISRVTRANQEQVQRVAGPSRGKLDVTGGMKAKLDALLRMAEQGIESVIMDGSSPEFAIDALFAPQPPGTVVEAWK